MSNECLDDDFEAMLNKISKKNIIMMLMNFIN